MKSLYTLLLALALSLISAASLPGFSSAQDSNYEEDLERAQELRQLLEARREREWEER